MDYISHTDDVIDSRDVIAAIEELESDRATYAADVEKAKEAVEIFNATESHEALAAAEAALAEWDEENTEDLQSLKEFAAEGEGYSADWRHGVTCVNEDYWVEYCEELVQDIGDLPRNIPGYLAIDWQKTAENIKQDYTSIKWEGNTFYVR